MLQHPVSIVAAGLISLGATGFWAVLSLPQVDAQNTIPSSNPQVHQSGWLQDLNLTSQQLQQIKMVRKQSKDQIVQKRQAVRQAQQELEALMAGTASKEEVRNKYNQLKMLRQQLTDSQFENTLAIREVLNPQQRQKFVAHMYKR